MNKPSSTSTAAGVAGLGMTVFWELIVQFNIMEPRATLVAASVGFVSALVAYLKKETVLPVQRDGTA